MNKKLFTLALMSLMASYLWAKDIRTATFTTLPQMHCNSCETKIKSNIRFEKGVKRIATDVEKQRVVITYDADKTTIEKLIQGFAKIDYKAELVETGSVEKGKDKSSKRK
ncbi:MAG: heavy-metal-associated domain-containing protein [Prevotella sp.]|nr:heavy-metal-associated domain-containing protein [Prevotella sp.]MDY3851790.1 heavy-metal-associated domain-containing protein [Prevotella sp.]